MAYILNIETATKNCSVSIGQNGETVALSELNDGGYSHAENLHKFIDETLKKVEIQMSDLSAVAVSMGPGSYTGLRIGVSAAKGLCFALDIPLIAVPTLEVLARSISVDNGFIIPLLDARRMEVYSCVYDAKYSLIKPVAAEIIDEQSFKRFLKEQTCYFLGDGAAKCQALLTNTHCEFMENKFPSANEMSKISHVKYTRKDFADVAYFEPFYLKDFIVTKPKKMI